VYCSKQHCIHYGVYTTGSSGRQSHSRLRMETRRHTVHTTAYRLYINISSYNVATIDVSHQKNEFPNRRMQRMQAWVQVVRVGKVARTPRNTLGALRGIIFAWSSTCKSRRLEWNNISPSETLFSEVYNKCRKSNTVYTLY
jgi:hypothetical protein